MKFYDINGHHNCGDDYVGHNQKKLETDIKDRDATNCE